MKAQYIEIFENGDESYYSDREMTILHRLDGPAIKFSNGYQSWLVNGELHRLDGPAVEYSDGSKAWFMCDKRHRIDGPAVEYSDGDKEWWVHGKRLSEGEFQRRTAKEIVLTLDEIAVKFDISVEQLKITK